MESASAVAAAVLQVLVFAVIPFVTYLATRRRWRGFLRYVGLRACSQPALLYALGVFLVTAAMLVVVYAVPSLRSATLAETSTAGQIAQLAITPASIFVIVVVSFIQTGLSEELLFRGFVAKRLIARLGFERGNALQSAVFVAPHLLLFLGLPGTEVTWWAVVVVAGWAAASGWLFGWLNERRGDGSIVPSWLAHGAGNALSYTVALLI